MEEIIWAGIDLLFQFIGALLSVLGKILADQGVLSLVIAGLVLLFAVKTLFSKKSRR